MKDTGAIRGDIRDALDDFPIIDIHTHLGHSPTWRAGCLRQVVSYHWLAVELCRAAGRKLIDFRESVDDDTMMDRLAPHFAGIRNTVNHYALMGMLRDLYGVQDRTITPDNWRTIDAVVRGQSETRGHFDDVTGRCGVRSISVAYAESGDGHSRHPDSLVSYRDRLPEWAGAYMLYEYAEYFFLRDNAKSLHELAAGEDLPRSLDGLGELIDRRVAGLADGRGVSIFHVWQREDWIYRITEPAVVGAALKRCLAGDELTPLEQDTLQSWAADRTAQACARDGIVLQMFHGSVNRAPSSYVSHATNWSQEWMNAFALYVARNPDTKFDLFLGTPHAGYDAVSMSRINYNLSVSGAWWHGFTPTVMHDFFRQRLEMLPNTAWNAFYSDAYSVEWLYAKQLVTKNRLSQALAGMVDEGFVTQDDAIAIARRVLHDNPKRFYAL